MTLDFSQYFEPLLNQPVPRLITANAAASPGDILLVDTTQHAITVTLPTAPTPGDQLITIIDATGNWGTNNLTLDAGANTFADGGNPAICDGNSPLRFQVFWYAGKFRIC